MLDRGLEKWLFSLIVRLTIKFFMTLSVLKTFVVLTSITAVTFILSMKRICITTPVMYGEHLLKVTAINVTKGLSTNEYMAR
jgi:hypothetical protein